MLTCKPKTDYPKQRNRCIKNGEGENAVRSWDGVISSEGERVTEHRSLFVKDLQGEIDALDKKILKKEIKLEKSGEFLEKQIKQLLVDTD